MNKQAISTVSDGFSNLELGLHQDMEEKPSIESSNEKLEVESRKNAKIRFKPLRGKQKALKNQEVKAKEVREERATGLHAPTIIGNHHILQKPVQAPRLTNHELNPSDVTQQQMANLILRT